VIVRTIKLEFLQELSGIYPFFKVIMNKEYSFCMYANPEHIWLTELIFEILLIIIVILYFKELSRAICYNPWQVL
jgi:hypothetical protein